MTTEPTEDRYISVLGGGMLSVDKICRRCGALIGQYPTDAPEGTVTPEMVHDNFHDRIDTLEDRFNAMATKAGTA